MSDGATAENRRVVVVGGGVAGIEALLALHDLAGDLAAVTLIAPEPDFLYKPLLVEEPFDIGPAERHELAPLAAETGARFVQRAVSAVRPEDHLVELDDGSTVEYDYLVVCVGGRYKAALEGAPRSPQGRSRSVPMSYSIEPRTRTTPWPSSSRRALPGRCPYMRSP